MASLLSSFDSAEVQHEANGYIRRIKELGLETDWEGSAKEFDFARLVAAAKETFPPGGSIETGVLKGGTSGVLILGCAKEAFHISIDPYGLSTQSYPTAEYADWGTFRRATRALCGLAHDCNVNYSHYLMDSLTFVRGDLLIHPGRFNIVHLDGDHSYHAVRAELEYFTGKLAGPTLYILDDHDENYPGVGRAVSEFPDFLRVLHRKYDFPPFGIAGFSAWVDIGGPRGRANGTKRWRKVARWRAGRRSEAASSGQA